MKVRILFDDSEETTHDYELDLDVIPRKGDEVSMTGELLDGLHTLEYDTAVVSDVVWHLFEDTPEVLVFLKESE